MVKKNRRREFYRFVNILIYEKIFVYLSRPFYGLGYCRASQIISDWLLYF